MRAIQYRHLIIPELFSSSYTDKDARRIELERCERVSAVGDSEERVSGGSGGNCRGRFAGNTDEARLIGPNQTIITCMNTTPKVDLGVSFVPAAFSVRRPLAHRS